MSDSAQKDMLLEAWLEERRQSVLVTILERVTTDRLAAIVQRLLEARFKDIELPWEQWFNFAVRAIAERRLAAISEKFVHEHFERYAPDMHALLKEAAANYVKTIVEQTLRYQVQASIDIRPK